MMVSRGEARGKRIARSSVPDEVSIMRIMRLRMEAVWKNYYK